MTAIIPIPRCSITTRLATNGDIPFIDGLQKMHSHMVGWMPTKQIEGKIRLGHVLVAEQGQEMRGEGQGKSNPSLAPGPSPLAPVPIGYCISSDQYSGRDDVGIIYQLNVLPMRQRHLIGASLIKAVFERAAYGCRLFCLWCAQDIQANYFWETIGFVPLAFRTGSASKQRIHIFWQRRVRDDATPYWFPSQTKSGAIREDRIVLPIPAGMHWRDLMPVVLPVPSTVEGPQQLKTLPGGSPIVPRPEQPKVSAARKMAIVRSASKHLQGLPPGKAAVITAGGVRYIDRGDHVPEPAPAPVAKPKRERKPAAKHDPQMMRASRELRDRFLEDLNSGRMLLPDVSKYDVGRQLTDAAPAPAPMRQIAA